MGEEGWGGVCPFQNWLWRKRGGGGGGGGVWDEGGRQRGRGESLTSCSPPSHKRSAEQQRRAGRPRKQTAKLINGCGEGGAGMAFRLRLHGVFWGGMGGKQLKQKEGPLHAALHQVKKRQQQIAKSSEWFRKLWKPVWRAKQTL